MTRVYAVGSWSGICEHLAVACLPDRDEPYVVTLAGFAVTEGLRAALAGLDDEGLEHYAMTEAAQASLGTLHDEGEPMRRLVLVVETDEVTAEPQVGATQRGLDAEHPGLVEATFTLPDDVEAWLVDTDAAAEDVTAAAAAYRLDQDDVRERAEACLDHELAWYAATELDEVMSLR